MRSRRRSPGSASRWRRRPVSSTSPDRGSISGSRSKAREAARIPAAGFETEYLLHGPVALLDQRDALVLLDDGGPATERVASIATAAERTGAAVHRIEAAGLAQPLGVFPLTASVQRIALELAEQLGVNPDSFGFDDPQRWAAFEEIWPEL